MHNVEIYEIHSHSVETCKISPNCLLQQFRRINFCTKKWYCKSIWRKNFAVGENFRNYHTVTLTLFVKYFVRVMVLLKKLLKRWFDENFVKATFLVKKSCMHMHVLKRDDSTKYFSGKLVFTEKTKAKLILFHQLISLLKKNFTFYSALRKNLISRKFFQPNTILWLLNRRSINLPSLEISWFHGIFAKTLWK